MSPAAPFLAVGLGNPGPDYEGTRHNIGADAARLVAARLGERLRAVRGLPAFVAEARASVPPGDGARLVVATLTTYMNLSGEGVGALVRYHKVPLERVIVIHDDLDLPLGDVRVKQGGGTGGHRGLNSIVRHLRSQDFTRVRIGIGRPHGRKDASDYVLEGFSRREGPLAGVAREEAADAVTAIIQQGVAAAQNRFNIRLPPPAEDPAEEPAP